MHLSFLDYLVDPLTHEPLELEASDRQGDFVEAGLLHSSTHTYPIVRGIPRFVEFQSANYSRSFGYQWHKWPRLQFESDNLGKPMAGHTRTMWERITDMAEAKVDLNGALVADIGCGPGRFIDVARSKGARVIGIDYSDAVEVAEKHFKNSRDVCICQANALNLPLRPRSMDGVFSIGVLHHTPNPERGVAEALRLLRPGGWCALSVYGQNGYYDFPAVQFWRKIFKALWPMLGPYPPLLYTYGVVYLFWPVASWAPPLGKAIRALFPFVKLPDIQWSLLDTFDSVTPSYQSAHSSYEVYSWLKRVGFTDIQPTNWGFTSFRGNAPTDAVELSRAA